MTTPDPSDNIGVIHYAKESRRLMLQANYELERKGDRVQASEKAAGAVAHAVKAMGESRHWHHDSHNRRRRIVNLIAAEFAAPDLNLMQDTADKLHDNFYENTMYASEVRDRLNRVIPLLSGFMELLTRAPNPEFIPTPEQELMLRRLRLTAEEIEERAAIEYPPPIPDFEEDEEDAAAAD